MKERVKYLPVLEQADFPVEDFMIVHSAWLAMMEIRENRDLDVLISSRLRKERFCDRPVDECFGLPGKYESKIRIHGSNSAYCQYLNLNIKELLSRSVVVDGLQFIEPGLYFRLKQIRLAENEKAFRNLQFWKRGILLSRISRLIELCPKKDYKIILKIKKDDSDLNEIRTFLSENRHKLEEYSDIPETAWELM